MLSSVNVLSAVSAYQLSSNYLHLKWSIYRCLPIYSMGESESERVGNDTLEYSYHYGHEIENGKGHV